MNATVTGPGTGSGTAPAAVGRAVPSLPVVAELTVRALTRLVRLPSLIVPILVMPVFFVVAFSGSFSGISDVEGYPTDEVVNWVAAFAMLQGASFGGVGAAGVMANDLENGFIDRLLSGPARRSVVIVAPLVYAGIRTFVPVTTVLVVALLLGADLPGGPMGVVMAYVGAVGLAMVFGAFGLGVVLRIKAFRAMSVVQMTAFLVMFPSIGQVPIALLSGWMEVVARFNPITNILRMTRQGFIGDVTWADTWPGLLALAVGLVGFGWWARHELDGLTP